MKTQHFWKILMDSVPERRDLSKSVEFVENGWVLGKFDAIQFEYLSEKMTLWLHHTLYFIFEWYFMTQKLKNQISNKLI